MANAPKRGFPDKQGLGLFWFCSEDVKDCGIIIYNGLVESPAG